MRILLAGTFLICLTFLPVKNVNSQFTQIACSRRVIETYPVDQRHLVITLLDEARPVADEFVRLLGSRKLVGFLRRFKNVQIFFNENPSGGKQIDPARLSRILGRVSRYEYWNQEIVYNISRPEIDPQGRMSTSYRIWTDKFGGDQIYVFVETRQNTEAQIVITGVAFYGAWAENQFTEELRRESGTMKCQRMESGLKYKAASADIRQPLEYVTRLRKPTRVTGAIGGESHDSYVIRARKGQIMTVRISWRAERNKEWANNHAEFYVGELPTFDGDGAVNFGKESNDGKQWSGTIPRTKDYYIYVMAHPVAHYTLRVTLK